MQRIQEKLQLKAGRLRNVAIAGHKFKNIPVYEHSSKRIRSLFKEYQYSLPKDEGSIGFDTFHYIVKLLMMCDESKSGLCTYYIKFYHENDFFYCMIDRIGQIDLNCIYIINIIGFSKPLNK